MNGKDDMEEAQDTHRRMPDERIGVTTKIEVGGMETYVTSNTYPGTNDLGEIFLPASKEGSTISGLFDAFAIIFSMALQYGVPLEKMLDKLEGLRFEPMDHRHSSIMDAFAKYLRAKYLKPEEEEENTQHISTLRNVKGA